MLLPVPVPEGGGGLSEDEGGDRLCGGVCLSVESEFVDITFVDVIFVVHAPGAGDVPSVTWRIVVEVSLEVLFGPWYLEYGVSNIEPEVFVAYLELVVHAPAVSGVGGDGFEAWDRCPLPVGSAAEPLAVECFDAAVVDVSNMVALGGGLGVDRFSNVVVERFAFKYLDIQAPGTCRSTGVVEPLITDFPTLS